MVADTAELPLEPMGTCGVEQETKTNRQHTALAARPAKNRALKESIHGPHEKSKKKGKISTIVSTILIKLVFNRGDE
jgi:hypothetical protein